MRKFWKEFKSFVAKGNIVDLAFAVIIGSAFNKIVTSLVNDVIMPLISLAVGGADVSEWKWVITPAEYDATGNQLVAETALKYGNFIQTIIDFMIIALTLFVVFKIFTYSKKKFGELGQNFLEESEKLKAKYQKKLEKMRKKGKETKTANIEAKIENIEQKETEVKEVIAEAPAPEPDKDTIIINLLTEIRDDLKANKTKK